MNATPSLMAFAPLYGGPNGFVNSVVIAATSTASAATLLPGAATTASSSSATQPQFYSQVQVANQSTSGWAYVNFGTITVTAASSTTSYPIAPGGVVIITAHATAVYVSVVLDTGATGNVIFTRGQGL